MIQYKCDKCKKVINGNVFGLDAYQVHDPNLKIIHTYHVCSTCYANFGLFMMNNPESSSDSENSVNFESGNYLEQNCGTCKYEYTSELKEPCKTCNGRMTGYCNWEAKDNG